MRRLTIALMTAVVVLAVTACGSGGTGGGAQPLESPLSTEQPSAAY